MQPFRSDIDALEARHAALAAEVADRLRARDEAARMLAEARACQRADAVLEDFATGGPARRRRYVLLGFIGTFAVGIGILTLVHLAHQRRDMRDQRVLAQFEAFTSQMCACTDRTCTMRVSDAMQAWAMQMAKRDDLPDDRSLAKMRTLGERMGECMTHLFGRAEAQVE